MASNKPEVPPKPSKRTGLGGSNVRNTTQGTDESGNLGGASGCNRQAIASRYPSIRISSTDADEDMCDFKCALCSKTRYTRDAKGYCTSCSQFLCYDCIVLHLKNGHVLLQLHIITTETEIGRIVSTDLTAVSSFTDSGDFIFIKDVYVKDSNDLEECHINKIIGLSNHRLAVTDLSNNTLKIVNADKNIIESIMKFQELKGGITSLPNDMIALAVPSEGKVKIFEISPSLKVVCNWRLGNICYDVEHINGNLLILCIQPLKFLIVSLAGKIQQTIIPNKEIAEMCPQPCHMAVSENGNSVFITYEKFNAVIKMNLDGETDAILGKQIEIFKPNGIVTVGGGHIFLCDMEKHTIWRMKQNLSNATIVLDQGDGLAYPAAIFFRKEQKQLFISSRCSTPDMRNSVKMYQQQ